MAASNRCKFTLARMAIKRRDVVLLQRVYRFHREQPCLEGLWSCSTWEIAFSRGYAPMLECLQRIVPLELSDDWSDGANILRAALKSNTVECVEWLFTHFPRFHSIINRKQVELVAGRGHVPVMQWLHQHVPCLPATNTTMDTAVARQRFDMVLFLHENRTEGCTTAAMDNAAACGWLEIVLFLHENRTEACTTDAMDGAAHEGHLEMVEFLDANRTEGCSQRAMGLAIVNEHRDVCDFLLDHRRDSHSRDTICYAIRFGDLDDVKWVHRRGIDSDWTRAMKVAINMRKAAILNYLVEVEPSSVDTTVIQLAARIGCLKMFKILDTRTDLVDGTALTTAATGHRLELVKYLVETRQDGCLVQAAIVAQNQPVKRYLVGQVCPTLWPGTHHDCTREPLRQCQRRERTCFGYREANCSPCVML